MMNETEFFEWLNTFKSELSEVLLMEEDEDEDTNADTVFFELEILYALLSDLECIIDKKECRLVRALAEQEQEDRTIIELLSAELQLLVYECKKKKRHLRLKEVAELRKYLKEDDLGNMVRQVLDDPNISDMRKAEVIELKKRNDISEEVKSDIIRTYISQASQSTHFVERSIGCKPLSKGF